MSVNPSSKKLIVEGDIDGSFFEAFCYSIGYRKKEIWVGPPADYAAGKGRGKGNAIDLFVDLVGELRDGRVSRLGLIVDADYASKGGLGYSGTLEHISGKLGPLDYAPISDGEEGIVFAHAGGLPDIGVWIMPNNRNEGYLEDFCIGIAARSEATLLRRARTAVTDIDTPKFPAHFKTKAEMATWLAWQEVPGQKLAALIGNNLIDTTSPKFLALKKWLKRTFD